MKQPELQNYRDKLIAVRDRVRQEVGSSIEALTQEIHPPGDDVPGPVEGIDAELAYEHNEEEIYHAAKAALERIDKGTYGTCQNCGTQIRRERLNALPWTAFCVDCALQNEVK